MRTLVRLRQDFDLFVAVKFAFECETLARPRRKDDFDGLSKARCAFCWVDVEYCELGRVEASSGTPIDPPTGEDIEERDLLGDSQRMNRRRRA